MRPEAVDAMLPFLSERFANPSGSHRFAREARTAVDDAREVVAEVLGAAPGEVVFTSGGTEGDNTAVLGTVARRGGTAVCPAAEHHAVALEHVLDLAGDHRLALAGFGGGVEQRAESQHFAEHRCGLGKRQRCLR